MTGRIQRPLALLGLVAALALPLGCRAPGVRGEAPAAPRPALDDYRLVTGEARSPAGCRYAYRVYEPLGTPPAAIPTQGTAPAASSRRTPAPRSIGRSAELTAEDAPVTVMLGHGFLRDQDTLVGLARALANADHRAVTLDFCNMRPWNGHHERNARDLRALAERIATGPVVYAGFSAGALAAVLAGREDPATLGIVTLDLVDMNDLARDALRTLEAPIVGLQGPPSACNAQGSGQRVFDTRPDAPLETLVGASHCEFESPTDRLCELACGDDDDRKDDARVRAEIVARVVDTVGRLAGRRVPRDGVPPLATFEL